MTRVSDILQLAVSLAVVGLFWLIYPGVMALVASAVGLLYVAAAVGVVRGSLIARRIALGFSLLTAVLATLGVLRFAGNGFRYWSGNFDHQGGMDWLPYVFLAVAIGATLVVVLQLASARRTDGGGQS